MLAIKLTVHKSQARGDRLVARESWQGGQTEADRALARQAEWVVVEKEKKDEKKKKNPSSFLLN